MTEENQASKENSQLADHLVELVTALDPKNIPIVLGGGMSVYLRQLLYSRGGERYDFTIEARSTSDLDVFLSSDVIVDKEKVEALRDVLDSLGYKVIPAAKNFQFSKKVKLYGQEREVEIDLLASPPSDENSEKVVVKSHRIKPTGAEKIHAYLTREAADISLRAIPVDISRLKPRAETKNKILFIPSAFNTLVLKLFAFNDRKDRDDAKSDFGRHHAFDILLTVAQMGEADWKDAKAQFGETKGSEYLQKAVGIRKECFVDENSLGVLRLRENKSYSTNRGQLDPHLDKFLEDLRDLFPG